MSSATQNPTAGSLSPQTAAAGISPIYMVLGCTLFAAAAQVLLKFRALHPIPAIHFGEFSSIVGFVKAMLGNLPLAFGYER